MRPPAGILPSRRKVRKRTLANLTHRPPNLVGGLRRLLQAWAPILFDDDAPAGATALRESPVAPARRSPRAERKAARKRTERDEPVDSFQTLLAVPL